MYHLLQTDDRGICSAKRHIADLFLFKKSFSINFLHRKGIWYPEGSDTIHQTKYGIVS